MKNKLVLFIFSITILIIALLLISIEVYYIAIALIAGFLVVYHREIWSLIKYRKLPPVDERVHENINKSIRNSFLFSIMTSLLIILFYVTDEYEPIQPDLQYFLGGLLLLMGVVYILSYLFYDKVEDNLNTKDIKKLRVLSFIVGISLIIFIINAFFVNMIFPNVHFLALHRIMLYTSPLVFMIGLIYGAVIFIKGLFVRAP